jgi:Fe-S-cluster containining protein
MSFPDRESLSTELESIAADSLCSRCTAKCCQYFALGIDTPTTWEDFDDIRWFLAHEDVSVFVDGEDWYIMVFRRCRHVLPNHACGIYPERMRICREYSTDDCEFHQEATYDRLFENDLQIWEYAEALLGPRHVPPRRWQPAVG